MSIPVNILGDILAGTVLSVGQGHNPKGDIEQKTDVLVGGSSIDNTQRVRTPRYVQCRVVVVIVYDFK